MQPKLAATSVTNTLAAVVAIGALLWGDGSLASAAQAAASASAGVATANVAKGPTQTGTPLAGSIKVLDPKDPSPLVFQSKAEQFQRRLFLKYGDEKSTPKLLVQTSKLEDFDGNLVDVRLGLEPSGLVASDPAVSPSSEVNIDSTAPLPTSVVLSADLPRVGEYVGVLTFRLGDPGSYQYQFRELRITRGALNELPVKVSDPRLPPNGSGERLAFNLTTLEDTIAVTPISAELTTKTAGNPARYDKAAFAATCGTNGNGDTRVVLPLSKANGCELDVIFTGLGPGEYTGKLVLDGKGYARKEVAFSLTTRRCGFFAFVVVALGAALSYALKRLTTRVRPRLVVRSAVSKLLVQADGLAQHFGLDVSEAAVLSAIRARLKDIEAGAKDRSDPPAGWAVEQQKRLTSEGAKLEVFSKWVNARRLFVSANLPVADRDRLQKALRDTGTALTATEPLAPAVEPEVGQILDEVTRAMAKQGLEAVQRMEGVLAQEAPAVAADQQAVDDFESSRQGLNSARSALESGDLVGYEFNYGSAGLALYQGLARHELASIRAGAGGGGPAAAAGIAPGVPRAQDAAELLRAALAAHDMKDAERSFLQARAILQSALPSNLQPARAAGRALQRLPVSATRAQLPIVRSTAVEDTASLDRLLLRLDTWLDVSVVVVSGLLGVVLIWWPNATWGQPYDFVAAFLWGTGLHTVGASMFEGVLSVRSKLAP